MSTPFNLLIEIGTEEIPSRYLRKIAKESLVLLAKELKDLGEFGYNFKEENIELMVTPRRIIFDFKALPSSLKDIEQKIFGPPKHLCQDENGKLSKQALGFAKAKGLDEAKLFFESKGKIEVLAGFISKKSPDLKKVIAEACLAILGRLSFEKTMVWGNSDYEFIRPIRTLTIISDNEMIDSSAFECPVPDLNFSNKVRVNPQVSLELKEVHNRNEFYETLKNNGVIPKREERKANLLEQVKRLSEKKGLNPVNFHNIFEEVSDLTESPNAIEVEFDPSFLRLPKEVLMSEMVHHQKFIPLEDSNGKLSSIFIGVADNPKADPAVVSDGFKKVISARFQDGLFFFENDLKKDPDSMRSGLKKVSWQKPWGSVFEKTERISKLSEEISKGLSSIDSDALNKAAIYCKNDLISQMVIEFPELQGIMGFYYLSEQLSENSAALAVRDQYLPSGPESSLPETSEGLVISLADKIDSLAGLFLSGKKISSSADPYGMRRMALGIIRISKALRAKDQKLDLRAILKRSSELYEQGFKDFFKKNKTSAKTEEILDFLMKRFQIDLKSQFSAEISSAITEVANNFDFKMMEEKGAALSELIDKKEFGELGLLFKRVSNILAKSEEKAIDGFEDALSHASEKALFARLGRVENEYKKFISEKNYVSALREISLIGKDLSDFFDQVLVMDPDPKIREARLSLLARIRALFIDFADLSKLSS